MKKKGLFILSMLLVAIFTVACGSSGGSYKTESATMDYVSEGAAEELVFGSSVTNDIKNTSESSTESQTIKKLIKTVDIDMETKEFSDLIDKIQKKVNELNGYIEDSSISGNSYNNEYGTRYANFTIRIPENKLDGFVIEIGELGNITHKNESVKDVTLEYVDVESHKNVLLTEQERLMVLLEKAETMEDIIAIEQRLSNVRYEIESYESRLRTLDNKVDYSTVNLYVDEVERLTEVAEKTFFGEIAERFMENIVTIYEGIKDITIWFISSIPYFIVIGAFVFVFVKIILLIFESPEKRKERKDKNKNSNEES